jgi:lysyl-tRNA synthetase class 2
MSDENPEIRNDSEDHDRLSDELESRKNNLKKLEDWGISPWGTRFICDARAKELHDRHDGKSQEEIEGENIEVAIAGRLTALRKHGKASFGDILDGTGTIQLFMKFDALSEIKIGNGEASQWDMLDALNLGDWVGAKGTLMKTRTGELSLRVKDLIFLTKALRPLPEKYHGLKDKELRYRYRYLDLVANPDVRDVFLARTKIIQTMRTVMNDRGFIEVETPSLHKIAGGAAARPFNTHLNALDIDLKLRISLELNLKRLMIGGIERVYEIGKVFRNEGIDRDHNPEFTLLEVYEAFGDLETMRELTEALIRESCEAVKGETKIIFRDMEIDLGPEFGQEDFNDLMIKHAGVDLTQVRDVAGLKKACDDRNLEVEDNANMGRLIDVLYSEMVEPNLVQPAFVYNYPEEISPLARKNHEKRGFTHRFELFIAGHEIANAFTELNDPIDQRERFEAQAKLREEGDDEAHPIDEDFLYAMEHGMAPAGGMGMGVDRVVMLITGAHSIRDVIFFPMMR